MTTNLYGGYAYLSEVPGYPVINETPNKPHTTCTGSPTCTSNATSANCPATNAGVAGAARVGVAPENTFTQELGLIIVGALAFIISFMWKDFITDMEHIILPNNPSMLARFLYTMTITIFVISLVIYLKRYLHLSGIPHFDDHPEDSGD